MRFVSLVIVLSVMTTACSGSSSEDDKLAVTVDRIVTASVESGHVQGVAVVVAKNGSIVLDRGYGLANIEHNVATTRHTVLDYFSIGKHITATILLRLAERGEVNLDEPAQRYLPDADFEQADVTVRQLLTHTSGLWEAEENENDLPAYYAEPPPPGALLQWANKGERLAGPGETWMYSNGGYLFAGLVAEKVSDKKLEALITDELALPLELESFAGCKDLEQDVQSGYTYDNIDVRPIAKVDAGWWGGSGNVCGTAGDLVRWWLALRSERVISKNSMEQMFSPVTLSRGDQLSDFGYGLGIRIGDFRGHRKIGHTGSGSGGTAVLAEYPESGLVVLVIVNTTGEDVASALDIEAEISASLLELNTALPERRPIPVEVLANAPGEYQSPYAVFCVSARDKELWLSVDHSVPEPMYHSGEGTFVTQHGGASSSVDYFLGTDSGKANWFGYNYNGFPQDLAIRTNDQCE